MTTGATKVTDPALAGLREYLVAQLDGPTFHYAPNDAIVKAMRERLTRWIAALASQPNAAAQEPQCWLNGGPCVIGRCEEPRYCAKNDTVAAPQVAQEPVAHVVGGRKHGGEPEFTSGDLVELANAVGAAPIAAPAPLTPVGWKLVSIEPTQAMLDAAAATPGIEAVNGILATHFARQRDNVPIWPDGNPPLLQAWRAMLAASPTAPSQGATE